MSDSVNKFQQLLRELFQFDCADLDFGIYRIMNSKRAVIERFISEDLPKAIAAELAQGALAEQAQAAQDLEAARKKVLEALGEDALDAEGTLAAQYQNTRAGKEYLAARERAKTAKGSEALETSVYNHLYAFFSRYWQDGDFISKRRYSKKERYAIPYNGEEVTLYWANHDQYYIKTGEYFTDYTWKAPNGVTVHFKLQAADVEQNNVKGEKRFFIPLTDQLAWDAETRTVTLPFHFRPLTAQEAITYGPKNQQEAIIARAMEALTQRHKDHKENLSAFVSLCENLEHHLRRYTRRNTSDFFIHKDLRGFLSRELDFYLKNEVLNLDELLHVSQRHQEHKENLGVSVSWCEQIVQLLRLIKKVGGHIIEFLAQIEDFQKMLWEKKKFVTETFYVITVGNIPEAFYPEIAACEAQWEEWEGLLGLSQRHEEHKENLSDSVSSCEQNLSQRHEEHKENLSDSVSLCEQNLSQRHEEHRENLSDSVSLCEQNLSQRHEEHKENLSDSVSLCEQNLSQRHEEHKENLGDSVSSCETPYLVYRGTTREGRRVAVIWRETAGWTEDDYRRDRDFVAKHNLTDGADEIFVNGDSLIPGAQALETVFKAKMFG